MVIRHTLLIFCYDNSAWQALSHALSDIRIAIGSISSPARVQSDELHKGLIPGLGQDSDDFLRNGSSKVRDFWDAGETY